ncbi:MAG TPA: glycosyl hydrolase, partial [Acidobacteriaceae bacterium]|nr:glycosyl hydrolase [Acidobacteriaceae bacterium]
WIHRSVGTTEIYFVANRKDRSELVHCTFRVSGKQPEIWDCVTGKTRAASAFVQSGGRTSLPLELPPYGSLFVVFTGDISTSAHGASATNAPRTSPLLTVDGPWTVHFDPKWGGPESVTFSRLESWTARVEEGIRYYSGSATYRATFRLDSVPKGGVLLDLGEVKAIAHLHVNGIDLGAAWTKPFRVDASRALRAGENLLEVEVVNLWPNRLIGDGLKPAGERLTSTNVAVYYQPTPEGHKLLDSGLLGPVRLLSTLA